MDRYMFIVQSEITWGEIDLYSKIIALTTLLLKLTWIWRL